jgi:hypothetical protein
VIREGLEMPVKFLPSAVAFGPCFQRVRKVKVPRTVGRQMKS